MAISKEASLAGIVRAADVQAVPVLFDTAKSLQKLADLASDGASMSSS
jgi:hypothetical protein